ncbi:phage tail protein [Gorillibacterium sp. CAU 1737]|uniref:phage tail protein n=1 Tax=Gorillibacterium sp. CAU 1737 TaxID=3140362 RepID=UPI003260E240
MVIASFQKKVFSVSRSKIYTLTGLEWSGDLSTESQDKVGSKPSTYIKGLSLGTFSFDLALRMSASLDVRAQIEAWELIRDKASADYFILGGKPLGKSKWLLKSVGVGDTEIDSAGRLLKATLKLSFEEYVRAGTAEAAQSANKAVKSSQSGPVSVDMVPMSYVDKSSAKRRNPQSTGAAKTSARSYEF